jgi:MFS family permease
MENAVVTMRRIYPFALAGLMLAISFQLFSNYIMWFGFWDGFASELDVAEHSLATYFVWFSTGMGVWFLSLGLLASRIEIKKPLLYACILFLVAATVAIAIDLHFRTYMTDSSGG